MRKVDDNYAFFFTQKNTQERMEYSYFTSTEIPVETWNISSHTEIFPQMSRLVYPSSLVKYPVSRLSEMKITTEERH